MSQSRLKRACHTRLHSTHLRVTTRNTVRSCCFSTLLSSFFLTIQTSILNRIKTSRIQSTPQSPIPINKQTNKHTTHNTATMGAVASCFNSVVHAITSCFMAIVNGIVTVIKAIINVSNSQSDRSTSSKIKTLTQHHRASSPSSPSSPTASPAARPAAGERQPAQSKRDHFSPTMRLSLAPSRLPSPPIYFAPTTMTRMSTTATRKCRNKQQQHHLRSLLGR
jgi:hypothetical protein